MGTGFPLFPLRVLKLGQLQRLLRDHGYAGQTNERQGQKLAPRFEVAEGTGLQSTRRIGTRRHLGPQKRLHYQNFKGIPIR